MNDAAPSPFDVDALFLRLALAEKLLTPDQVRQIQHLLAQRSAASDAPVTAESLCREQGLLTGAVGERLARRARVLAAAPAGQGFAAPPDSGRLRKLRAQEDLAALAAGATGFKLEDDAKPVVISGHRLLKRIGRGGMGEVYKALQLNMDRVVALKILTPRLAKDEKYIARFRREARAAGRLNHPNLVLVYDVGEDDGKHYFSMEYVEGRTVKEFLKREGRFTPVSALNIIEQIAAALECAHRGKIIHRDIKPDNILLTAAGTAKLADLGLAKVLEGSLHESETQTGVTMGTPRYMSPEQARAEATLDHRADLYSLGATLYHMLTGEAPFDGSSSLDILLKVLREPPPRPDRLEPLLPPPLTQLVLRLLAKDPAERPQTAACVWREVRALRDDLEAGRVFIFNDTPTVVRGTPRLRPTKIEKNVGKISFFLTACVFISVVATALFWSRPSKAIAAPPPPLFFYSPEETPPPGESPSPSTTPEPSERTAPAPLPPTPTSRLPNPSEDENLQTDEELAAAWMRVLNERPQRWVELAALPLDDRANDAESALGRLKASVENLRQKAWRDYQRQRALTVEALIAAGAFSSAEKTASLTPPWPDWNVAAEAAVGPESVAEMRAAAQAAATADAKRFAERIERLLRLELFAWARVEAARRDAEARADGRDETATAARIEADIAAAEEKARMNARSEEARLHEAERVWNEVRALTARHEFKAAEALCAEKIATTDSASADHVWKAEQARLRLIGRLFATLAAALRNRSIPESHFRKKSDNGDLIAVSPAGLRFANPGIERVVAWRDVQRDELRRLADIVFTEKKWASVEPVLRAALDADDERFAAAAETILVAGEDADAHAYRRAAEIWVVQKRTYADLMATREAERLLVAGKATEALPILSEVWRNLGANADSTGIRFQRIQELLKLVWEARFIEGRFASGSGETLGRGRVRWLFPGQALAGKRFGRTRSNSSEGLGQGPAADDSHVTSGFSSFAISPPLETTFRVGRRGNLPGDLTIRLQPLAAPFANPLAVRLSCNGDPSIRLVAAGGEEESVRRTELSASQRLEIRFRLIGEKAHWSVALIGQIEKTERISGALVCYPVPEWRPEIVSSGGFYLESAEFVGIANSSAADQIERDKLRDSLLAAAAEPPRRRVEILREVQEKCFRFADLTARCRFELSTTLRVLGETNEAETLLNAAVFECPLEAHPERVKEAYLRMKKKT